MKNICYLLLIGLSLAAVSFINPPDALVGRWQQKLPDGVTALFVFRTNDTHEIFLNGKSFSSGNYYVHQDTLGFADPFCNLNYYATYKLNFFAPDSLRFDVLSDTCSGRREGYKQLTMGRVPKP